MPSPFPGMDPYLEHPWIWPDVHSALMVAIRDDIAAQVSLRYYVALESRIYLNEPGEPDAFRIPDVCVLSASENGDGRGDGVMGMYDTSGGTAVAVEIPIPEEVRETYLEIRDSEHHYMITAVELLSPSNKRPGRGRALYEEKRMELLGTWTNLVEIDLLRAGEPMAFKANGMLRSDYRILVARGGKSKAMLHPFGVRQHFPEFQVPLRWDDHDEPTVDIGKLMSGLYDRARYRMRVDYTDDPVPPLSDADAEWADGLLKSKALR